MVEQQFTSSNFVKEEPPHIINTGCLS